MPAADGFPPPGSGGLFGISQRLPPQNADAEQALLGALLANNRAYERVAGFLRRDHFADPVHGAIYEAIAERIEQGHVVDVVTLRTQLEHTSILDDAGGPAYLAQLLASMVGILNAGEYGRLIIDCAMRRDLIIRGEELVNLAFGADPDADAAEILERHLEALQSIGSGTAAEKTMVTVATAVARAMQASMEADANGGMTGISCGYPVLDDVLGGLEPGNLIINGARPGMGKTALALGIARRLSAPVMNPDGTPASDGLKVGIIELEMKAEQVARRMLAQVADVHYEALKRGYVWRRDDTASRTVRASQELAQHSLMIEDAPGLRVGAIAQRARAMRREMKGLDLLIVDHLHLIGRGDTASRHGDTQAISEATAALKALAKDLNVPLLLLAQLNRGLEQREDKRPGLADLRQSGSIEQDADVVTFVHRPEYYLGDSEPEKKLGEATGAYEARCADWRAERDRVAGVAEIIVAKNREGPGQKIVPLHWSGARMQFYDPQHDRLPLPGTDQEPVA